MPRNYRFDLLRVKLKLFNKRKQMKDTTHLAAKALDDSVFNVT